MPGKLRVQFEGAIDHAMSRGDARQDIVADDRDRQHFVDRLGSQVRRSGWELIRFVLLSNHFRRRGLPTLWPLARGAGPDRPSRPGPRRRRVARAAIYVDRGRRAEPAARLCSPRMPRRHPPAAGDPEGPERRHRPRPGRDPGPPPANQGHQVSRPGRGAGQSPGRAWLQDRGSGASAGLIVIGLTPEPLDPGTPHLVPIGLARD